MTKAKINWSRNLQHRAIMLLTSRVLQMKWVNFIERSYTEVLLEKRQWMKSLCTFLPMMYMLAWYVVVLRKLWKDPKYGKLFKNRPKFVYRRGWSNGSELVRWHREKKRNIMSSTRKKGTYPCLNCGHCTLIIKGNNIHHPKKGYNIPVCRYFTCDSSNMIYMLKMPMWDELRQTNYTSY